LLRIHFLRQLVLLSTLIVVLGSLASPPSARLLAQATELTPIYVIQGNGLVSPKAKMWVDSQGIVTGVTETGFYLQDPIGDGDPATSDGIFVYTRTRPALQPGQCLRVENGYVDEFYEKTELSRAKALIPVNDCATTQIEPVVIPSARLGSIPAELFERYEGMLVQVENLVGSVQGPTKRFDGGDMEIVIVAPEVLPYLAGGRVFQTSADNMAALTYLSGALGALLPDVAWGDRVLVGVQSGEVRQAVAILDYNFGKYQLILRPDQAVTVEPQGIAAERALTSTANDFTICTFNLLGLGRGSAQFPEQHDYQAQVRKRALAISESLQGCTIIALQETGLPEDAQNLALELRDVFGLDYTATSLVGPQSSNLEFPLTNSLLTRNDRVQVVASKVSQSCSPQDYAVEDPENACPVGEFALFDRLPLVVDLMVRGDWGEPYKLRIVNNHLKSKGGDELVNVVRREQQTRFVATLVQEQLTTDPAAHVVVLGDLNDYYVSGPIDALRTSTQPALLHAYDLLPPLERFTYIFNGASQVLDHILVTPAMAPTLAEVDIVHIDAHFPALATVNTTNVNHASDHDPVQIRIRPAGAGTVGGNLRFAGFQVQILDAQQQPVAVAQTDDLGDFRIWNLPPGEYLLRIKGPVYLLAETTASPELELPITVAAGYNPLHDLLAYHRTVDIAAAAALLSVDLISADLTATQAR